MAKSRGINTDIQAPRTKLLYLIYSTPHSRIRALPGVKSQICTALGYKSDGHFHHDWNYLVASGMIEEKEGYFSVTELGKKEFTLQSTASKSNAGIVILGISLIVFTLLLEWGVVPIIGIAVFGFVLIFFGAFFSILNRQNKPELPLKAKVLIKQLKA